MAKKNKQTIDDNIICDGIRIGNSFYGSTENRLLTLLLKGVIVYMLSMGSIGFYLSSFGIKYNVAMCHIVIGIMAICCALLYYRLLVENLGYLFLLVTFGALVYLFRVYINSGFYAIVNITVDDAAEYFDIDIRKLYNEQIDNRYVTITCAAMFIGIVLDILLNVYISRRMQYLTAIFIVMFFNVIPLYMTEEPDMLYTIMLIAGIAMTYVLKSGRHYSPQVSVKRSDAVFENKKKSVSYVYDVKAMVQAGVMALVYAVVVIIAVSSFRPKGSFNSGYTGNKYKELTMAGVSTLLMDGWSGFFHMSNDVGGLDSGRLGDVSTVRLDYETDLVVQVTPYSYKNIYLRSFIGENYNPYQNSWTSIDNLKWYDNTLTPEADALKEAYANNLTGSARGIMKVRNVGADPSRNYLPYYTETSALDNRGNVEIEYYPRLYGNEARVNESAYGENGSFTQDDLYVPDENREVIADFVDELNLSGNSADEVVDAVGTYFQENIPYTIRPGKTPKNEDFVNYFLEDNQKGYCAHYASAATLIFRYMGIPARYVEGYAIDYYQMTDGELVEGESYSDYYDGYSELGETALVEVNVTDADAHAWVEIYTQGMGWQVVDVTPSGDEEEVVDFWEVFENVVGDRGDNNGNAADNSNGGFTLSDEMIKKICYGILKVVLVIIAVFVAIRLGILAMIGIRFIRADINDRLIMRYSWYCNRLRKRYKEYRGLINYHDQIIWVAGESEDAEHIIDILERAGFSNHSITKQEYNETVSWMRTYKKKHMETA